MPDQQLRFRLGYSAWFETGAGSWTNPPGEAWELELADELLRKAQNAPLFELPLQGRNDVEKRTNIALKWFEQAQLVGDPLMEVLFCFTALEAILGDASEGEKGSNLALRRGVLSLLTDDGMSHPSATFTLYDRVRSSAVHGEDLPELSQKEADRFMWDVRIALNQYLRFAADEGLTRRRDIRERLDEHPRRAKVEAGLLRNDPKTWKKFLTSSTADGETLP